jgi:hypothetical protein
MTLKPTPQSTVEECEDALYWWGFNQQVGNVRRARDTHMNVRWPIPLAITWPPPGRADAPAHPQRAADPVRRPRKARGARKPTLVSVAKQAAKAGIEVARYEVNPDGKISIVTGKPEAAEANNPWLADLDGAATKQ